MDTQVKSSSTNKNVGVSFLFSGWIFSNPMIVASLLPMETTSSFPICQTASTCTPSVLCSGFDIMRLQWLSMYLFKSRLQDKILIVWLWEVLTALPMSMIVLLVNLSITWGTRVRAAFKSSHLFLSWSEFYNSTLAPKRTTEIAEIIWG